MRNRKKKIKVVAVCLGDTSYISRFHRSCEMLFELELELEAYSVKPRDLSEVTLPSYQRLVDGRLRTLRGKIFSPLRQLEIVLRFVYLVYKARPDLIVAHNLPALVVSWVVQKLRFGKMRFLVYDAMELESGRASHTPSFIPFDRNGRWKRNIERFLARKADIVISADYARTEIMKDDIGREDILTCRNVPKYLKVPKSNLIRDALGLGDDVFLVLYQGLIAEGRGLEVTISSLAGLPRNIVFVIMGFGANLYQERLKNIIINHNLESRVLFLPAVPQKELLYWTASADVVHSVIENTCLSYYTAAPNKLYEAAMAGVSVVASNFPEVKAVLTRYPYGIQVNPGSVEEIAKAILYLFENPDIREKFREVGLEASRSELNWEIESQKLKVRLMDLLKAEQY